jgi:ribosomal protein S26
MKKKKKSNARPSPKTERKFASQRVAKASTVRELPALVRTQLEIVSFYIKSRLCILTIIHLFFRRNNLG